MIHNNVRFDWLCFKDSKIINLSNLQAYSKHTQQDISQMICYPNIYVYELRALTFTINLLYGAECSCEIKTVFHQYFKNNLYFCYLNSFKLHQWPWIHNINLPDISVLKTATQSFTPWYISCWMTKMLQCSVQRGSYNTVLAKCEQE